MPFQHFFYKESEKMLFQQFFHKENEKNAVLTIFS
jgi:hypothetical protein